MIFARRHEYSHWRPAACLPAKPGSGLKHVPYGNLVRTSHRVMQIMRGLVAGSWYEVYLHSHANFGSNY